MEGKEKEVMEEKEFDYAAAVARLETLVARVEDPSTGIDDIAGTVSKAEDLLKKCRAYLRQARQTLDALEPEKPAGPVSPQE